MPAPELTREARIYLALWRKAATDGRLEIKCTDGREANAMRMALYRALRFYKTLEGKDADPTLHNIAHTFGIVSQKNHAELIVIEPRLAQVLAEDLARSFGLTDSDLMLPEEIERARRLQGEVEALSKPSEPIASNPFFSRES